MLKIKIVLITETQFSYIYLLRNITQLLNLECVGDTKVAVFFPLDLFKHFSLVKIGARFPHIETCSCNWNCCVRG